MLKEAGQGSLPGGGAEIFAKEIRDEICKTNVQYRTMVGNT